MSGTVMVVDDDDATRDALAMLLEVEGYRVTPAADGTQALSMLHAGARPIVVLLDLMMPRMGGVETVQAIRSDPALAGIPIVVLSGDAAGQKAATEAGATGYLKKPVELDALLGAVKSFG